MTDADQSFKPCLVTPEDLVTREAMSETDKVAFPLILSDDIKFFGYGHTDKAEFARQTDLFDEHFGSGPLDPEDRYSAADVSHIYATGERNNAEFRLTNFSEQPFEGATPITALG